jgi:hypothetical protein
MEGRMVEEPDLKLAVGKDTEARTAEELELEFERMFQRKEAAESNSRGHKVH